MFLACSYFFRNLRLNVLISMVLIKKKKCMRSKIVPEKFVKSKSEAESVLSNVAKIWKISA